VKRKLGKYWKLNKTKIFSFERRKITETHKIRNMNS